jgi:hypothetical protein
MKSDFSKVCELDLVWIRDGEFGVAEVERTPKKFSVGRKLESFLFIPLVLLVA